MRTIAINGFGRIGRLVFREILRRNETLDCGSVRAPLAELIDSDYAIAQECVTMIQAALAKYC